MSVNNSGTAKLVPEMIPLFPPCWAEVLGEDKFGIFAELTLNKVSFVFRWIPPGRFQIGSPDSEAVRLPDNGPVHSATITQGYWIGETPITQLQWSVLMPDNPSRFIGDHRPVEHIPWHSTLAYAGKLNEMLPSIRVSLPTAMQWEYACTAGTQYTLQSDASDGAKLHEQDSLLENFGWFIGNSDGVTHDVKQKSPNGWGIYDMYGNIWEWCLDSVHSHGDGFYRAVRGGSCRSKMQTWRSAFRVRDRPGYDLDEVGFRLCAVY